MRTKNKQLFKGIERSDMNCNRHLAVFKHLNVIPKYCFECYKVLITPRNVIELFKLMVVFERDDFPFNNVRKCMVEQRPYCSGNYKGFIYCTSVPEAEEVCATVSLLIAEEISPEISVSVKRGCSEYGKTYPDYERIHPIGEIMQYIPQWQAKEDYFDKNAVFENRIKDPDDLKLYENHDGSKIYTRAEILCMQHWLRYAATIGDTSYLPLASSHISPLTYLKGRTETHK